MTQHWQPGDHILLREISRGQVWSGRPYTVVEDTPCRLILYAAAAVRWMRPARPDGANLRMREPTWILKEDTWHTEALRIVAPGSRHSVLLLWTAGFQKLLLWYVNLEDPLVRTPIGFDYLDQLLDIEIAADLSGWRWKDEDEFAESVATGLIATEQADVIRDEGEAVITALNARRPPFDEPWDKWRPDPRWTPPGLPDGWSDLHKYPARGGDC